MARANLNKNENLATNTTEVSEYVHSTYPRDPGSTSI